MDSLTFVGMATTLIRLGGFTVLTDPNFLHKGQRAYLGKGLGSKRLAETPMQPEALETLTVESLPGIHARDAMGALLPPIMGSLLEHPAGTNVRRRVYLSGDTLAGDHVSEIARRHPDIDTAVVHLAAPGSSSTPVTMDA